MNINIINTIIGGAISLISSLATFGLSIFLLKKKTKYEKGSYRAKLKFDKEFEIYQELSEKNLTAVYDVGTAVFVVNGQYKDDHQKEIEHLEKLLNSLNDAEFSNKKYAPFINKEIFQEYKSLEVKMKDVYYIFRFWVYNNEGILRYKGHSYSANKGCKEYIETTQKEISALSDKILDDVRTYLNKTETIKLWKFEQSSYRYNSVWAFVFENNFTLLCPAGINNT